MKILNNIKNNDFIQFLNNPKIINDNFNKKTIFFFIKYFLIHFFISIPITFLIALFDYFVVSNLLGFSLRNEYRNQNDNIILQLSFFNLVIFGPFIEEIISRLALDLKKWTFNISLCFFYYFIIISGKGKNLNDAFLTTENIIKLISTIILFFILQIIVKINWFKKIKKNYFKYWFYLLNIGFALLHIRMYEKIHWNIIFIYPIYFIPFFISSLFMSYFRCKYNFWIGLLFHSGLNSIPFIVFNYIKPLF